MSFSTLISGYITETVDLDEAQSVGNNVNPFRGFIGIEKVINSPFNQLHNKFCYLNRKI